MPATENVWRNLRTMHIVFAISTGALFVAVLLMMHQDHDDEWRRVQTVATQLQTDALREEESELKTADFQEQEAELEARVAEADKVVAENKDALEVATKEANKLDGEFQYLSRTVKFQRAERDKARADLDLKVRDGLLGDALKPWQKIFDDQQAKVDELELALQKLQAQLDTAKAGQAQLTKVRDDALAAKKKHRTDLERINKVLAQIAPTKIAAIKNWIMKQPIIDGFNGPQKISQIWTPELTINYGGMKDVARFDRCITCHVNIDKVASGNVASYPHDPHGVTMENAEKYLSGEKRTHEDGTPMGFGHPFSTHPNPDLYLTSASPHPMQKFGCTSCHEGQGSATSFQNASHTPNSPDIGEEWHHEYGYHYNHFWEYPMYPQRLAEAACIKCHHNVVELGVHPKFGASAPKAFRGYELIREYGCFGCHEINGFNAGKAIGPDMRLEPQTAEEAERIAADPTATAGTMRKVGPGLRHFAAKTNKAWAEYWVEEPKKFRPETRMPQFFNLSNQQDHDGQELQPVEIAGIVEFLFAKSQDLSLDSWADDYTPDAERGKLLFSQRGCLSCHSHDDFPEIKQDFGPNLTHVHQKLTSLKWVYTWIREPTRHSPRTKMPNLYLEPETVLGKTIDPAADIAAFLLSKRDDEGKLLPGDDGKPVLDDVGPKKFEQVKWEKDGLEQLARLYLSKVLTKDKVDAVLEGRTYPEQDAQRIKSAPTQPDEIELVDGQISDETLLRYIGRRTISRYGCYGCHDIPGYEKARPIGTALQDWGRKDPTKLALEHIEEYLHHHGEPDGESTAKVASQAVEDGINHNLGPEEYATKSSTAFFYGQLLSHGRAGFLWQKLRDPRSYDYKKTSTKGWDERLRMPKFPFNQDEIEAVSTFVLGLVAEPPAEKYVYRPQGAAKARIDGEKLLTKYNCTGCHTVELPEVIGLPSDLAPEELAESDWTEAFDLLKKLKAPRDGRTNLKTKSGENAVSFHGLLYQPPDPEDDPEDQAYYFDLWETLHLGKPDELMLPGRRMEVPVKNLVELKPGRGGDFAEWLVGASMKADREVNRDKARQMAPPVLYLEGKKVQTQWLYTFLKSPGRLRYTTVLRMPQFTLSDEEARTLANYFAAVDGVPFPYQDIPQRDVEYVEAKEKEHPGYLKDAWKLLSMAPPVGLCAGCHSVGGREFVAGDPTKVTRGPNLDGVYNRFRPDFLELWIYKPKWIIPYTAMPQNFPKDKPQFPELFGGNGSQQSVGARDALMNYLKLLEQEGKATAAAPAAPAKEPADAGSDD